MPSLTLKNVPPGVHRLLKARAVRHHRSLNREALECLQAAVMPERLDPDAILADARRLRARVAGRLSEAEITALKRAGRP